MSRPMGGLSVLSARVEVGGDTVSVAWRRDGIRPRPRWHGSPTSFRTLASDASVFVSVFVFVFFLKKYSPFLIYWARCTQESPETLSFDVLQASNQPLTPVSRGCCVR